MKFQMAYILVYQVRENGMPLDIIETYLKEEDAQAEAKRLNSKCQSWEEYKIIETNIICGRPTGTATCFSKEIIEVKKND